MSPSDAIDLESALILNIPNLDTDSIIVLLEN